MDFFTRFTCEKNTTKQLFQSKGVPHLQISVNLLVPVKKARKTGGVFGGQNLKNEEKLKKKFQKFLLSQIVQNIILINRVTFLNFKNSYMADILI